MDTFDLIAIAPELILAFVASDLLLTSAFIKEKSGHEVNDVFHAPRAASFVYFCSCLLLIGLGITFLTRTVDLPYFAMAGLFQSDPIANLLKAGCCFALLISLIYSKQYLIDRGLFRPDFLVLTLFALLGQLVLISASNLITLYLGLELMALSTYGLVAMRHSSGLSSEAAIKYFVLGALASGFLLYGMSMIYGVTGSLDLLEILRSLLDPRINHLIMAFGLVFIVAGVDWGRTHDFTAASLFCCHCGYEVALDRFNQVGWEFQRGRLLALFEKWQVREVCVETNSIGGPNLEALRKRMPDGMYAVGFETTSKSKGPMIQALALAIEQQKIRLQPNQIARHELISYEAEVLASGYTRYGAPEGGWDDTVIARGLAWHKAKSRTPYPQTGDEKIEAALPVGWQAANAPAEVGSWMRDGWEMAREARKAEIEEAMKKASAGQDDPWNPTGGLSNIQGWAGF
ncbi:MAG: hypothetical protein EBW77_03745 [Burkholderiaceae bacterium]|nr:hypothetical protein [Burkholderiaceae bacterium]